MGQHYGNKIPAGMTFCFDALNPKCYSGSGTTFTDIISGVSTTAVVTSSLGMDSTLGKPHLKFTPGATTRTAYIPFSSTGLNLPKGYTATISIWAYFQDQGNIDHPMVGWETTGSWVGTDGFVVGTGWGTDGTRVGVAGNNLGYTGMENTKWLHWVVTFNGLQTNGLKLYKNTSVILQATPTITSIGTSNTNDFNIGATNSRGGNWGGYLDLVQIWDRELSANEVTNLYNIQKGRFE